MMQEYFFELLTEEIPAWMLPHAGLRDQLLALCAEELGVEDESSVSIGATSRRMYFALHSLPEKQTDRTEEVKGPPKRAAYDAEGKPTAALNGFLKKNNAAVADLLESSDDYIRVKRVIAGKSTANILEVRIPQIIEGLRWPKMMHWGDETFTFIRPVHSVISLLNGEVLTLHLLGTQSGRVTVGHRTLSSGPITVSSFADYKEKLRQSKVVISESERESMMRERCGQLAAEVNGTPNEDSSIWSQWRYLTEYPGVVRATFRDEYLSLPEEVLITVMRVHQKQLPIMAGKHLTSSFLAVMDNEGDPDGNAAIGNAFVTNARFADARFFYETDRRRKLAERDQELSHLQFQEKLGDYLVKSLRIEKLARLIGQSAGIDPAAAAVAGRLSKADLVTEMVKEFTDLQGQVGGIYLREEGQPPEVWKAVYDHYLPVSLDGALPRTIEGAIVSLADKADTLAGFFLVGIRPSGSKDPFGLRRAAQGAVQILLNDQLWTLRADVTSLVSSALSQYDRTGGPEVESALLDFVAERVRTVLETERFGLAYDEIAAAMASGWTASLPDLAQRAQAVREIRREKDFLSLLDSAKRISNITAGSEESLLRPELFEHPSEKRLNDLTAIVADQIEELTGDRRYLEALRSFAGLAPELETFFNDVMVMVEDESVKRNRLALLRRVGGLASKIADVTKIVVDRSDYR
ncbi:MAG TPA: glycine--tRNA ligase subunit beta [Thermoanaerobaculia bacterium]|nr:glycine--tRNA ligase subunit beta [Thermoanaerobaculia bacterium]